MLDNFLFIGASEEECQYALQSFLHLTNTINLPLAEKKTVYPTTCLTFLGIELDTLKRQARMPNDNVTAYLATIDNIKKTGKVTARYGYSKGRKVFLEEDA